MKGREKREGKHILFPLEKEVLLSTYLPTSLLTLFPLSCLDAVDTTNPTTQSISCLGCGSHRSTKQDNRERREEVGDRR